MLEPRHERVQLDVVANEPEAYDELASPDRGQSAERLEEYRPEIAQGKGSIATQ
jgi:hypothetical protein